jgi:hypothetical protein
LLTIRTVWAAVVLGLALSVTAGGAASTGLPFKWFEPDATVSPDDYKRLARREVVVKPLSAVNGQLGVFAVTPLSAEPDVFVEWIRQISQLQRSKAVSASRRFSEPPVLSDLDALYLDARDLEALRRCRVAQCAIKLSNPEIELVRRVAEVGSDDAIQVVFRRVLFERLMAYRAGGLPTMAPARSETGAPAEVFAALRTSAPYIRRADARLAQWLEDAQGNHGPEVESFFYWSKEYYASGKAVIALTQVGVTRATGGGLSPEVAVSGKQLFASRYMNGMLSHITVSRDPATGVRYMTYSNRAQLDALKGFWSGVVRTIINGRLRGDAATVLGSLRDRIESGPPKNDSTTIP